MRIAMAVALSVLLLGRARVDLMAQGHFTKGDKQTHQRKDAQHQGDVADIMGPQFTTRASEGTSAGQAQESNGQTNAKDAAIKKDRKRIEGYWKVVAFEVNGNKAMDEDAKKLVIVNGSDGTWRLLSEGKEISRGTSTFDPTKLPKTLDFTPTEGAGKDSQFLGIYELGENTRRMCFAPPGKNRPTEFASTAGSEHVLVTFERAKAK